MYTQFYGLREKPFSLSPDPRYLFLADSHREALAHLLYGIEQGEGFIAITGEVGTGKTTLCRTLLQRIEPGTEVAFIFNPQLSPDELLQAVCAELGLDASLSSRRELVNQLNRFLLEKKAEGRKVLLIIDEAQNLPMETLEQIRMLSNLETDTSKLVQIILIGQPELDDLLETHQLRQLRQRISVRWRLKPLSALETRDYVRHRLRIAAGAPRELFSELALREVHRRSRGVPRVVNLLCDRALLAGYASGARSIGLGIVTQTDREMRGGKPISRREKRRAPSRLRRALPLAAVLVAGLAGGVAWQLLREPAAPLLPPVAAPPLALAPVATKPAPTLAKPVVGAAVAPAPQLESPAEAVVTSPAAEVSLAPVEEPPAAEEIVVAAVPPSRAPAAPPPPKDLSTALAQAEPAAATAAAFDALLARWQAPPSGVELLSLEQALAALREQDLSALPLRGARLATLRHFDRPAFVKLRAGDGGERVLLLESLEAERARISGLLPGADPLGISLEEFDEYWTGDAWVVWRDFESLPALMRPGLRGAPVAWLQHSLGRLGFYRQASTGEYDAGTFEAVQAFQASRRLNADGTVGPVTKMALYDALGRYVAPQLVGGANGG